MNRFADLILPLPLADTYTYRIPESLDGAVAPGKRVIVNFGPKKFYTAIVEKLHDTPPQGFEVKDIEEVLDQNPVVTETQLKLWRWIAAYYLCSIGEVYKAAIPARMKMESETVVTLLEEPETERVLSPHEQKVADTLAQWGECSLAKLKAETGIARITAVTGPMIDDGIIAIKEEMKQSYKPRYETRVRIADRYRQEDEMVKLFDSLSRSQKQLHLLMKCVELTAFGQKKEKEVAKSTLLEKAGASHAIFKALADKGILTAYKAETGRLAEDNADPEPPHPLSEAQQQAYDSINTVLQEKNVCLFHGVTSSGKTEIYIRMIEDALKQGKQVLYLLPEIALTKQITDRLKRVFAGKTGIYHSKFTDNERVEIWNRQAGPEAYSIIIGVRSSVFLPFHNLGLVIVDEEHENTYKQFDPAPRYNARNTAIVLAAMCGAKTLLGTATPSVESYYNAMTGKYGLVTLKTRYKGIELPQITVVDTKDLRRRKIMKGLFSPYLTDRIRAALEKKEQVILFQNRRGFAPMMECHTCGWVPRCINCDVSLTYHKGMNQLTCHYCGYSTRPPVVCPACEGTDIRHRGIGTELVEEEIQALFPQARTARMDLDTTRSRTAYEKIINDFQQGKTDILIGTQMVSKGLDFDNVSVVGIINADNMLNYPDFRSYERAFQLIEQVAGRAGRKNGQGMVIIQTGDPENIVIREVVNHDYEAMYRTQAEEREIFKYPPFYRMTNVYLKHKDGTQISLMANTMAEKMRQVFGARVLGPDRPPVGRIQTYYIRKIVLKTENKMPLAYVRDNLRRIQHEMKEDQRFKSLSVYFDVDPM